MNKLCIYYSLSGNCDVVAEKLKSNGYSIVKVITKKKMPNNKFLRILICGYKATIGYKDSIENININIDDYEKIVIVSPIWNDRLASPINALLDKVHIKSKSLTFVLCSGSGKADKASQFINANFSDCKIINLANPKKNFSELDKLKKL